MTDHRALALAALQDADGEKDGAPRRTEQLLTALTHAVLALAPEPGVSPPPAGETPRALRLLWLIRRSTGEWDAKRALAAYTVLGEKAPGQRALDATMARKDLAALADTGLIVRLDSYRFIATDDALSAPSGE